LNPLVLNRFIEKAYLERDQAYAETLRKVSQNFRDDPVDIQNKASEVLAIINGSEQ